jgi:hypothetical protein
MKNLLALLGAAVIVLVAVGWYCDWFQFHTKTGANGDTNLSIEVDATKAANDLKKTEQSIEQKIKEAEKAKDSPPDSTKPAKDKPDPSLEVKDSPKDPKFQLNLFGPDKK